MLKIGITGQAGFIGTHLYNTLGLYSDKFERVLFEDEFFLNSNEIENFVTQCDVIVHLAAMNRHANPEVIYKTNIDLVNHLTKACEKTKSTPYILFSSSTQEDLDNLYGKSKREGRQLLEQWAKKNKAQFTGFIIPNVYGPFGQPFHNSVVATFCYQLTHHETPKIDVDGQLRLIYIGELIQHFIERILVIAKDQNVNNSSFNEIVQVPHSSEVQVSTLLKKLTEYRDNYIDNGTIPNLDNEIDRNLFNTFLCYIDHSTFFPFKLKLNADNRGAFVETMRLNSGGQVSFSTTVPGITRGNHFHTRKLERFAIIKGKARIEIRQIGTDKVISFELDGKEPSFVDMPIWFTHNITNIGDEDLITIFWISEHFSNRDTDTFFELVSR